MTMPTISAVVCTKNSIASIERCLASLKQADVHELIVVDARSVDGTTEIAAQFADKVLFDEGTGLGAARNIGIAETSGDYILNFGSDNVLPPGQLDIMRTDLVQGNYDGVSAQTFIEGSGYLSFGLNTWRQGRFRPGPAHVIGTPTLFKGDQLRGSPYDETRIFSDDSELCERWQRTFNSTFAISSAFAWEIGKATLHEIAVRARMYGISDHEVFRQGREQNWSPLRQVQSFLHPFLRDFLDPVTHSDPGSALAAAPFLAAFTSLRYVGWMRRAREQSQA